MARSVQTPPPGAPPSHSQVSPLLFSPVPQPPNSTRRPRAESAAIAAPERAEGPGTFTCVHAPFHRHVSPSSPLVLEPPPKRIVSPRAASYATAAPARAAGTNGVETLQA